jgi:hypothetical protein
MREKPTGHPSSIISSVLCRHLNGIWDEAIIHMGTWKNEWGKHRGKGGWTMASQNPMPVE